MTQEVKRVFKYPFHGDIVETPPGKVRLVAPQQPSASFPTLWVEHTDTDLKSETCHKYCIVGTGYDFVHGMTHVGSCVCADGALVWHVYSVADYHS